MQIAKLLPAPKVKIEEPELVDLTKEIKFHHKVKEDPPKKTTKTITEGKNCGPFKHEYDDCDCMGDDMYDGQMTLEEYYRHYYGYGYM